MWWWIKIISPSWWVWTSHFPYILLPVPSPSFVVSPSFCEIVRYVMLRKCFFQLTSLCNLFSGDNLIVGSYDRRLCWFDMDLSTKPYRTLRLVWNKQFWLRKEGGDLTEVFTSSNAKQPNWLFKLLSIRVTKIVDWMLIGREIYSCDERDRWRRSALRRLNCPHCIHERVWRQSSLLIALTIFHHFQESQESFTSSDFPSSLPSVCVR